MARDAFGCLVVTIGCLLRCIRVPDPGERFDCASHCIDKAIDCLDHASNPATELRRLRKEFRASTKRLKARA